MPKRTMATATAILALFIASAAIAGDAKLDEKIKTIDASVEKADAEALKVYTMAKIKVRQKALEDLGRLKKEAFAKEDLEMAKSVKEKIDATTKEIDDLLAAVKEEFKADPKIKPFVGTWKLSDTEKTLSIGSDGTVHQMPTGEIGKFGFDGKNYFLKWEKSGWTAYFKMEDNKIYVDGRQLIKVTK